MSETYISVDVEADGPIPGKHSMLSLGAAAYDESGLLLDTFSINIRPLPDASQDPATMLFWDKNKAAYEATLVNQVPALNAMMRFDEWVAQFNSPVFVAYPTGFDFTFVHWYFMNFLCRDPFGFSALDLKTFAMAVLGTSYKGTTKKTMPKDWFTTKLKHSHVALDDAIEQGELFISMLKYSHELIDSEITETYE